MSLRATAPLPLARLAATTSPCVRNCCLDDAQVCLGCGRQLEEILEWHQASAGRREEILAAAAARQDARLRRLRGAV